MTLYEINGSIINLMESCIDPETGEVTSDFEKRLADLTLDREQKLDNTMAYIKNLEAEAKAFNEEIKRLKDLESKAKNRSEHLKAYLSMNMEQGETFTSSRGKISWRKSERVIADVDKIPEQFKRRIEEVKPDLVGIKKAIKAGEEVSGAFIEERHNIQIK